MRLAIISILAIASFLPSHLGHANMVGTEIQHFNPNTNGLDFVTVHSSKTLAPGVFNLGLFFNYDVNSYSYFNKDGDTPQNHMRFNDAVTTADLSVGYGLMKNWELGISLPHVVADEVESDELNGQFATAGNTEVRVGTKIRLIRYGNFGLATILSGNINRTEGDPYDGTSAEPTYNLEFAADHSAYDLTLAFNVGYRWRNKGEEVEEFQGPAEVDPSGNRFITSAGVSYLLTSLDTTLITEVLGSHPDARAKETSDRVQEQGEARFGIRYDATDNLAVHVGGGSELIHGVGTPDWRAYAGLNMQFGTFGSDRPVVKMSDVNRAPVPSTPVLDADDPFKDRIPQKTERIVIHNVLFEFDKHDKILPHSERVLERLAEYLERSPKFKRLQIEGHTCSIGNGRYNHDLSWKRAETIRKWLIRRHGMNSEGIVTGGFGETMPTDSNKTYQGRQMNRRVEFKVYR